MKRIPLTFIVDDDQIFVFVLKKLMQKAGCFERVINITNGLEAIDTLTADFQSGKPLPDVIFLDLNMPVLDGWQFLDEVEQLPFKEQLCIYVVSSSINAVEIEKVRQYTTVKSFVTKPVTQQWVSNLG